MSNMNWKPHISEDCNGASVFEWWNGEKKITMYPSDNILLKIWGKNIDNEMEEISLSNGELIRATFIWFDAGS